MKSGVFQTIDLVQYNEQHCKKSTFYQPNAVNCAFVGLMESGTAQTRNGKDFFLGERIGVRMSLKSRLVRA
jgi:hypothetical protein